MVSFDKQSETPSGKSVGQIGFSIAVLLALAVSIVRPAEIPSSTPVDFTREVRPLLAENCFECHGFDASQRMAGLRLDTEAGAFGKLDSGKHAIVPRNPDASEILQRVTAPEESRMPPASTGKKLTPAQIDLLRRWIAQGAQYDKHWAFVKPKRPAIPQVKNAAWPKNPIDNFILARLEAEGLQPSPEADRPTLIRRLSLDLTGLPPTPEEVDRFVHDDSPDAYDRLVNRLLDSPHYGEKMALKWLDLARYADTHGYHIDSERYMWRWRDWVIDAFNQNMPYDEFTIEQIAGDELPNATLEQKIASGFNRNHPIDFEGGAIPEEYQTAYVVDRVDTTATTFMGLTMRCAQCHDHKYDPIKQNEYYQFYAFFNNISEQGLDGQTGNAVPYIKAPYPAQKIELDRDQWQIQDLDSQLKARAKDSASAESDWEKTALAAADAPSTLENGLIVHLPFDEGAGDTVHSSAGTGITGKITGKTGWEPGRIGGALRFDGDAQVDLGPVAAFDRSDSFSYGAWVYPTGTDAMTVLSKMDDAADFRGYDMYLSEGKVYVHLIHQWEKNALRIVSKVSIEPNRWTHLFVTYDGSGKGKGLHLYIDGQPAEVDVTHDTLSDTLKNDKPLRIGRRNPAAPFKGLIDDVRIYGRELSPSEVASLAGIETIRGILRMPAARRTAAEKESLQQYYLDNVDETSRNLRGELADWQKRYDDLNATLPTTMVMDDLAAPRETHILKRGQYDQKGDLVTPGTPVFLPPLPKDAPLNRLTLARWLVSPDHPLTARVAVNRYWQTYFGTGLVKTAEDFGTQGERPSHPELLDWLATEFMRTGWDVKAMQRLIVTSATYRQSSRVTPELLEKDPENRLLARAPRYRLPAEIVRDQALAISGLLSPEIGGPSVRPYQPAGLWEEMSFGAGFSAQSYMQDHGDELYRRSLYTFWKRTVPPPSLQTFDAPTREVCTVNRIPTDTPLQALVLMNDPTYIEASRKLGERIMMRAGDSPVAGIQYAFRLATARYPNAREIQTLMGIYNLQGVKYRKDPSAALKLLSVGESKRDESLDPVRLAAWTNVASVILNLDETITRS